VERDDLFEDFHAEVKTDVARPFRPKLATRTKRKRSRAHGPDSPALCSMPEAAAIHSRELNL